MDILKMKDCGSCKRVANQLLDLQKDSADIRQPVGGQIDSVMELQSEQPWKNPARAGFEHQA